MATSIVVISIVILTAILIMLLGFRIVRENEMGIRVTLGSIGEPLESGPKLSFWPIQKIIKFPTTQQSIKFKVPTIMTRRGKIQNYDAVIEPVEIDIVCTLYYNFDKKYLKQTVKKAPGPSEKEISDEVVPYLNDVIRTIVGRIPWRLVNEERYKFSEYVLMRAYYHKEEAETQKRKYWDLEKPNDEKKITTFSFKEISIEEKEKLGLTEKNLERSPINQFGLVNVSLAIEDINFTDDDLRKAISAAEKARLEGKAKELAAEAEKKKRILEGQGDAEARAAMIEVIKSEKDLEVLLSLRELAKGTSNTILYQLPRALESRVSDLLGGNSPGEMFKMMSQSDKKFFQGLIQEIIEELAKKSKGV